MPKGCDCMIKLTVEEYIDNAKIARYELAKRTGIRFHIIDNCYKNKVVRYDSYVLDKMCSALNCKISDITEHTEDNAN